MRGKSATYANMAMVLFQQGDRARARDLLYASRDMLRQIGAARDLAQVEQLLVQVEAAETTTTTIPQLIAAALTAVVRSRREQGDSTAVRAALGALGNEPTLQPIAAALGRALDGAPDAAAAIQIVIAPIMADAPPDDQAALAVRLADLAQTLGDATTESAARAAAVAAFRACGAAREHLVALSIALFNQAMAYERHGAGAAALAALEEVVALDIQTEHPDLASDTAALAALRLRVLPFAALVAAQRAQQADDDAWPALLDLACSRTVAVLRDGDATRRDALADDLAHLRAVRSLPIAGAHDALAVLQLWLRDARGMAERAAQIGARLPDPWPAVLAEIDASVRGEPTYTESAAAPTDGQANMPDATRAELHIARRVLPYLLHGMTLLRNPAVTGAERDQFGAQLHNVAAQAEAGEAADSPWHVAAAVCRTVGDWLRGAPTDITTLPEPYRTLIITATKKDSA